MVRQHGLVQHAEGVALHLLVGGSVTAQRVGARLGPSACLAPPFCTHSQVGLPVARACLLLFPRSTWAWAWRRWGVCCRPAPRSSPSPPRSVPRWAGAGLAMHSMHQVVVGCTCMARQGRALEGGACMGLTCALNHSRHAELPPLAAASQVLLAELMGERCGRSVAQAAELFIRCPALANTRHVMPSIVRLVSDNHGD